MQDQQQNFQVIGNSIDNFTPVFGFFASWLSKKSEGSTEGGWASGICFAGWTSATFFDGWHSESCDSRWCSVFDDALLGLGFALLAWLPPVALALILLIAYPT